jgi:hypothetical protein
MVARALVIVVTLCNMVDFALGFPFDCDASSRSEGIIIPLICLFFDVFLLLARHGCPIASEISQSSPIAWCELDIPFSNNQKSVVFLSTCNMFAVGFLVGYRVAAFLAFSRGCEWPSLVQLVLSSFAFLILWFLVCCQFRRVSSSCNDRFQCADQVGVVVPVPHIVIVSQSNSNE